MEGDIYHILNRGVDKRVIFNSENDYLRFAYSFYDFNDKNPVVSSYYRRRSVMSAMRKPTDDKDKLVKVLCWCLMPNHYHILVEEKINNGAGIFSKKITSGYTQYFNIINDRSGVLFQNRSKIIKVEKDNHFMHLPYYIFSNPIKLKMRDWKEQGVPNVAKLKKFLLDYKWSSYRDIVGKNNFPFIIDKNYFFKIFALNEVIFEKEFLTWVVGYAKADR